MEIFPPIPPPPPLHVCIDHPCKKVGWRNWRCGEEVGGVRDALPPVVRGDEGAEEEEEEEEDLIWNGLMSVLPLLPYSIFRASSLVGCRVAVPFRPLPPFLAGEDSPTA